MDAVEALRRRGGVARTSALMHQGVTARNIALLVRSKRVERLRHGVIALPDAPSDLVAAVLRNSLLTCASAATHHSLWLLPRPTTHHISRPGRAVGPAINHRMGRSTPPHPYLPIVGLVDALVHALHCLPALEAAVMVESALRRGDTTKGFLLDRLQGNRNGRARAVLDLVTGSADSALEVVTRIMFVRAGIDLREQVSIDGVGRVDFLLEGFLVVEVDGDAYHSDRRARRRDRRRNNGTIVGGYLVLRYGYEDIMFHAEDVLAEVMSVLRGRPVR